MLEYTAMNKDLFVYFLILLVPLCVLPFAVHRFLSAELARGRTLGRAYLGRRPSASPPRWPPHGP